MNMDQAKAAAEAADSKLRATYEKANGTMQAVMRASIGVLAVSDSKLDRSIKVDTLMAIMKALVCDIEIGTVMEIIKVAEKVGAPADTVMCSLALERLDKIENLNRRVVTLMDLFKDEIEQRIKAEEATAGAAA